MSGVRTRLAIAYLGNLIDTAATLHLYLNDLGEELNPISIVLLRCPPAFVAYKILMMTAAVVLIWLKRDLILCIIMSWFLCVIYILTAAYYLFCYAILMFIYA